MSTRNLFTFKKRHQTQGKLVAMKQKEQVIPSSSSSTLLINLWTWNDIHAVGRIDCYCFNVSKLMTRLYRHQGYPREDDGAIEWRKLLPMFSPDFLEVKTWPKQAWLNRLEKASDKRRPQYCSDSYGYILYMRAFQGHSRGSKVDLCRTMWKSRTIVLNTFITLVLLMTAILFSESGLIAGAKDSNKGRQTVFFTSLQWIP